MLALLFVPTYPTVMRLTLASLLFAFATAAAAAPADDVWMSVLLDGRKVGDMHLTRNARGGRVVTSQSLNVELDRAGVKVGLASSETDTETSDGKPLAFESRTAISGIASVLKGTIRPDGDVDVVSEVGGAKQTRTVPWPAGALLAEGLRLADARAGLKPGTHFSERAYQAESLEAVDVESTVGPAERIDLPDGARTLTRVDQQIHLPGAGTTTTVWVDAEQDVHKMTMSLMGYELTMLACSKACATAKNQSADILVHAMVEAPAALTPDELAHGVNLRVRATQNGGTPLTFATTDEQSVTKTADGVELHIAPLAEGAKPQREERPAARDSAPNDWLQSQAPEIQKLARQGIGDATSARERMERLETFVRGYIRNKDLNVGYASALEVAKHPEGDCTEHAVLLAALGRALGIPTRVVDGLAYTDQYAGAQHVFVPHAWAQAYVDGRWQSFDAALHGFDAGHIALSFGDGDPWRFFAGFDTLGRMRVEAVAAASPPLPADTAAH